MTTHSQYPVRWIYNRRVQVVNRCSYKHSSILLQCYSVTVTVARVQLLLDP